MGIRSNGMFTSKSIEDKEVKATKKQKESVMVAEKETRRRMR